MSEMPQVDLPDDDYISTDVPKIDPATLRRLFAVKSTPAPAPAPAPATPRRPYLVPKSTAPAPAPADGGPPGPGTKPAPAAKLPEWREGMQRTVLALSIRGDMLARSPQAVRPEPFGGGGALTSPRQRLATLIAEYWARYSVRPSPEAMDQLVDDERKRLGPAEGAALLSELSSVLAVDLSEGVEWVYDEAAEWADYRKLEDGLVRAADLLRDRAGTKAAREVLALSMVPDAADRARPIEAIDVADLVTRDFPDRPALVGSGLSGLILPGTFVITGGRAKIGKSAMVVNREIQRALGRPFLGFPTAPGRTLYIQAEIPEPQLKERIALMLSGGPDGRIDAEELRGRLITVTRRGLYIDTPAGFDAVRRLVEQYEPDHLSIDPLARFMSGEENSTTDMGKVVAVADRLIQEYGVAFELVHHTGHAVKGDPRRGGDRLRGSSALFAAADSTMMLDRAEDVWTLSFELRLVREIAPMTLSRTPTFWYAGAPPPPPDEMLVDVGRLVRDAPMTYTNLVAAIMVAFKASERTAKRRVTESVAAKTIVQTPDGYRQSVPKTP